VWHLKHITGERYFQNTIKNIKITTHFEAFFSIETFDYFLSL